MCVQKWEIYFSHELKCVCAGKEDREHGLCVVNGNRVLINTTCECGKGKPSNCTNEYYICVCVGRSDRVLALNNMTCLCTERGDQVLALNNTKCICGRRIFIHCTN